MKKLIYTMVVCLVVINSCNNLDLVPLDKITANNFYKTASEYDAAMFAAYSSIQDFWGHSSETLSERGEYWKVTTVITDDVKAEPGSDNISKDADILNIRASDIPFAAVYTQIYEGIYRCNIVLENLPLPNELTAEQKEVFEGEAKFLRAFFHFEAVKFWGTPPLVLVTAKDLSTLVVPNSTKDQLYAQILGDLNDAAGKLPAAWDDANTGRATSWTAKAYTGKVNVWKQDWDAAIAAFEDVIMNGPYGLIDTDNPAQDLEDAFAFDNENSKESIFEVQFGGPNSDDNIWVFDDVHTENFKASQGTGRSWDWDASGGNGAPGGKNGWWVPTAELVNAFEPGDARLNSFIYKSGDMYYIWTGSVTVVPYDPAWSSTGYVVKKYAGQRNNVAADFAPNNQGNFNNERLYRFPELKLLYAEALIEKGRTADARQQINDIRDRAGLPDLLLTDDVTTALYKEKRLELCFEPHRWFDIVRWGIGPQVFGAAWNEKYTVFPMPQSEIDRAAGVIKQNDGY
jgi:starch-binding outer membrane protein, SusD/RagB family